MKSSALVIGASRGIGRQIALTLAENGYVVGVAAKTKESTARLPGSVYSVTGEITEAGGTALAIECNVREEKEIRDAVETCIERFGHLDLAVYNAGAILWNKVIDTPLKRFDLMTDVNVRGAYILVQELLPHFLQRNSGKIVLVSPPIYNRFFKGKTPYSITKAGMTILTHGLGHELNETGVSVTSLWPATTIQAHVTDVRNVPRHFLRKPTIFADAVLSIARDKTNRLNGQALIDEDYLRSTGVRDFTKYRCDPEKEPPRIMPCNFPSLLVEEEDESVFGSKL